MVMSNDRVFLDLREIHAGGDIKLSWFIAAHLILQIGMHVFLEANKFIALHELIF